MPHPFPTRRPSDLPADFTFVCPTELEDLAVNYDEFKKLGVEIYSVSTDTHFSHKAWHDAADAIGTIKYPMIGDPNHEISSNFAILRPTGLADRGTFIVDPQGVTQDIRSAERRDGKGSVSQCRSRGTPDQKK